MKYVRVGLLILIVAGIGLLVAQHYWLPATTTFLLGQQTEYQPPAVSAANPTGWKTFIQKETGFTMDYPASWTYVLPGVQTWPIFKDDQGREVLGVSVVYIKDQTPIEKYVAASALQSYLSELTPIPTLDQALYVEKVTDTSDLVTYVSKWNFMENFGTKSATPPYSVVVYGALIEPKNYDVTRFHYPGLTRIAISITSYNFKGADRFDDLQLITHIAKSAHFTK